MMFDRIRIASIVAALTVTSLGCTSAPASPGVSPSPSTAPVATATGPTPTPAATPIPSIAPAAADRGVDWEVRNIIFENPLGREPALTGVIFTGSGFIAWGPNAIGGSAAIASNADTSSWGDAGQFDGARIAGMAWAPAGIVALGTDRTGVVHAWRSVDGTTWHAGPARTGIDGVVNAVISVSGAYYAAGTAASGCDVAVWISFDGLSWQSSDALPGARGACTTGGTANRPTITLLRDGPAGIVAYGTVPGTGSAVWVSSDRVHWTFHPQPAIAGHIAGLAGTRDGYAAVGSTGTGSAALWLSPDGATWTPAPDQASLHGADLTDVRTLDDGSLSAVGGDATSAFVAWTSPDGLAWVRSPAPIDPAGGQPGPPDHPVPWALASDGHASTNPSELLVAVGGSSGAMVSPPTTPDLRAGTLTVSLSGLIDLPVTTGPAACSAAEDGTSSTAISTALVYLVVTTDGRITDFRVHSEKVSTGVGQGLPIPPSTFTIAAGSTPQHGSTDFRGLRNDLAPLETRLLAGSVAWTCAW